MEKVLITGGSCGLGRALALLYQERGSFVTVLDKVKGSDPNISYKKFDLSSFTKKDLPRGTFDIVICNAGISLSGNFVEHSKKQNERLHDVNVLGHMELVRLLLRNDQISSSGRLCFVASASVFLPWPVAISYAASKASLDGFALALEPFVRGKNISVSRVYPGPMDTAHVKFYKGLAEGKGKDPLVIAKRIIRSLHSRRRRIFPDGASKLFFLLSCFVPRFLSWFMYKKYKRFFT